ncbi:DUF1553 domain-containing protein [Reichenbachiella versicolor]|uniref:DUF1553 domain-containing protein n=1 Tax=Reichenbachiella versicolor TaxID=1821036 RepID=UPI000D6E109A|nr:DUF1553 domain-containing protein [Reichenbachiella versicolor]
MTKNYLYLLAIIWLSACQMDLPDDVAEAYKTLPKELDFNIHVKPILSDKCFACHGPDNQKIKGGLQLHDSEFAYAELPENPGKHAIVPGSLKNSEAFLRIISDDPEYVMPTPKFNVTLTALEKATLTKWIEDGAKYEPHWSFTKIEKEEVPDVENEEWVKNEVDYFVLEKLEEKKLQPSEEASKHSLLRRLTLDLTGLPPTVEEIKAFVLDDSEGAYEKQVDRLLASEHYGEKMAADWLDLARFADTNGYSTDRERDMSPWRDWVINSFNKNQPYNEFVTWQLAGDLLPNATQEQILATGFNRLHPQNAEGGIVDEEFRVEYVADRASLTGQAFMGLTLACARCHDHKYDPISQKDFYEMYSFFNNVNETGQISWASTDIPVPTMLMPTDEQKDKIDYLKKITSEGKSQLEEVKKSEANNVQKWIDNGLYKKASSSPKGLVAHFNLNNTLKNKLGSEKGKMERFGSKKELPNYVKGKSGQGLKMDGDTWLDLKPVGIYGRADQFTVSAWVNVPSELEEGVIFHKNKGYRLYSQKGYNVYIKDGQLQVILAHTYPENAIIKISKEDIPRDQWTHIAMTYDGSSKASGAKLYLNGKEIEMTVENDNLYKEFKFNQMTDQIHKNPVEPGLKFGGRWRGLGLKNGLVDEIKVFDRELSALDVMSLGNNESFKSLLAAAPTSLSTTQKELLEEHYWNNFSAAYDQAKKSWEKAEAEKVALVDEVQEIMVMKEMEEPRESFILERGAYDAHGEQVFPGVPDLILPFDESYPKNRLGLAQWLVSRDHPLMARVTVNRYWQNYFGNGIVKTTEDFGNQGELPTHRELLDWLAAEFIESGWDVKALQKKMVMSATYRQSSYCPEELRAIDGENRLLARGPVVRLSSEMMRDNALKASGLMKEDIGGKSVKPYQPKGLYAFGHGAYHQDTTDVIYKRSLYVFWRRSNPNPTLGTFDQPDRSECIVRRQNTNTPLQALVLMNDPAYVEASRKLGESITKADLPAEGVAQAFLALTGREVEEKELDVLMKLREKEIENFKSEESRSKGWMSMGMYKPDPSLDQNLLAANTVVANVIMNSDAAIMKR